MTPKEKAKDLVSKNIGIILTTMNLENKKDFQVWGMGKQCALIAVDEIINNIDEFGKDLYNEFGTESYLYRCKNQDNKEYWQEVKQEIEKQ